MKENEDVLPSDILSNITVTLLKRCDAVKNNPEQLDAIFLEFLQEAEKGEPLLQRKIKLEFADDLDWVNVPQPLSLTALRGKFVILDFFTYCCINCLHVLTELHAVERLFSIEDGLIVIGVHSPKFEHEKITANILAASKRHDIRHPIVNDQSKLLWYALGINCWPSLLLINPHGTPIMLLMGEGHGTFLERFLRVALAYFEKNQNLERYRLEQHFLKDPKTMTHLRFPGKIACSAEGRYAITDVGNNRILIVNEEGLVLHKIGGNKMGYTDGDFDVARFHHPQGVSFLNNDTVLVADTENHVIRQISLTTLNVKTIVGVGRQGRDRQGGAIGIEQEVSSPYDIAVFRTRDMDMSFHLDNHNVPEKTVILIAMAGTHQIWGYFPDGIVWWKFRKISPHTCLSLVGSGLEENRNNCYPSNAAFAQPSGLAMSNDFLYIADSESSSVRKVSLSDGKVLPVVGGDRNPRNLFSFGDVDGKQFNAKLQHPLCVEYNTFNDKLYVADTYNNKIKVIDTVNDEIQTLHIKQAVNDDAIIFNEPSGLCVSNSGKTLLVSDSNNHELYAVDLNTLVGKRFQLDFSHIWANVSLHKKRISKGIQLFKIVPFRGVESRIKLNIILTGGLKCDKDSAQRWSLRSIHSTLKAKNLSGTIDNMEILIKLYRGPCDPLIDGHYATVDVILNLCDLNCCHAKRFSILLLDEQQTPAENSVDASLSIVVSQNNVTLQ